MTIRVTVKVAKSSDKEIRQLSKKFGDTINGVLIGRSGEILMVKTNKGQINPSIRDVIFETIN